MKKFFQTRKKRKELDGVNFFNENEWTIRKKIDDALKKAETPLIIETSSIALQERPSLTKKVRLEIVLFNIYLKIGKESFNKYSTSRYCFMQIC